jgi:hypothetical protein
MCYATELHSQPLFAFLIFYFWVLWKEIFTVFLPLSFEMARPNSHLKNKWRGEDESNDLKITLGVIVLS